MTVKRHKIALSLADRGRPAMWANEQEAAELSGVGVVAFAKKIRTWEDRGFPRKNPENGKRLIPAIIRFWDPLNRQASERPAVEEPSKPLSGLDNASDYDFESDTTRLDRYGKRIKYPPWTWQLLDRYRDHPRIYVYLGRNKVYWRHAGSREFAKEVTDPRALDAYAASLERGEQAP